MIKAIAILLTACLILAGRTGSAQHLQPGFDKAEYLEMLRIGARTTQDPKYYDSFPAPEKFRLVYTSPVMGLENLWDLWTDDRGVAALSIRGTVPQPTSWLANIYAAMVPAQGTLKISDSFTFPYDLATHYRAAVHVGWLVSTAWLTRDMLPRIDSLYQSGTRDFIITGHSQGGGISYLVTAYLYGQQRLGTLPADIRFKTYSSAAPKPGNLYFAYDYEAMTHGGWAFNVVNAADWVPETPISIQTLQDFNHINPLSNKKALVQAQKFPRNMVLKHVYGRLNNPTRKAQRRYQRYLGKMSSSFVRKEMPGFEPPAYTNSNHYVRTGQFVVLQPNPEYQLKWKDDSRQIWMHHLHGPYLFLAGLLP